jgi:hypothetical protein
MENSTGLCVNLARSGGQAAAAARQIDAIFDHLTPVRAKPHLDSTLLLSAYYVLIFYFGMD